MSDLALKINQVAYRGFESVHISRSVLNICGAFAASCNNFFQGGTSSDEIKMGNGIKIEIDGFEVFNGYIDDMPIKFGKNSDNLSLFGRDNTLDLVDCSWDRTPNEWKNQTVQNLIKTFCAPFGITVITDSSATSEVAEVLETYKINEGVCVSDHIGELCRDIGILAISTGDGNLTLTKEATSIFADDALIVGGNVEGGVLLQSNKDRFSSYSIKGYGVGTDNKALTDFVECFGSFSDPIITRYRPFVSFSENVSTSNLCRKRAVWEARVKAGLSRAVIYNADSWVQSSGKPWAVNQLVKVRDDFTGIDDSMVIASIDFVYDEEDGGDTAKIMVVPRNTFSLSEDEINIKTRFDI